MFIREIIKDDDIISSVEVLRESFKTVADLFGFTPENNPSHASFINESDLRGMADRGVHMFGIFDNNVQVGFVAIEKSRSAEGVYYLEKLAVMPYMRNRGTGRLLMDHSFNFVKEKGGSGISIGIIDEHSSLKEWYFNYGFRQSGIKTFTHLPFTVCFMEKEI